MTSSTIRNDDSPCADLYESLRDHGIDFSTGVPGSVLRGLFAQVEGRSDIEYVTAVAEDLAIGLAVGAYLGGRFPMVLMQNSGMAASTNALSSLVLVYRIPMLLLIGWRGHDRNDSPVHSVTGRMTLDLLPLLGIPYVVLERSAARDNVSWAVDTALQESCPVALVVRPGVLSC